MTDALRAQFAALLANDPEALAYARSRWVSPEDGDWVCHLCADGGLTPWPPGTECPNYPCQAFQRPRTTNKEHK